MLILNDFRVSYIFIDDRVKRMQVLNNCTNFPVLQTKACEENLQSREIKYQLCFSAPSRMDLWFEYVRYLCVVTRATVFTLIYLFGVFYQTLFKLKKKKDHYKGNEQKNKYSLLAAVDEIYSVLLLQVFLLFTCLFTKFGNFLHSTVIFQKLFANENGYKYLS